MPMETSAKSVLQLLENPLEYSGSEGAAGFGIFTASALAVQAAETAREICTYPALYGAIEMLVQAARSRRTELKTIAERLTEKPEALRLMTLVHEKDTDGLEFQQLLRESIDESLLLWRVGFDLVKILHRMASLASPRTGCDVETAVNLTLAAMSSLRTQIEFALMSLKDMEYRKAIAAELSDKILHAGEMLEETLDRVRKEIFPA